MEMQVMSLEDQEILKKAEKEACGDWQCVCTYCANYYFIHTRLFKKYFVSSEKTMQTVLERDLKAALDENKSLKNELLKYKRSNNAR